MEGDYARFMEFWVANQSSFLAARLARMSFHVRLRRRSNAEVVTLKTGELLFGHFPRLAGWLAKWRLFVA